MIKLYQLQSVWVHFNRNAYLNRQIVAVLKTDEGGKTQRQKWKTKKNWIRRYGPLDSEERWGSVLIADNRYASSLWGGRLWRGWQLGIVCSRISFPSCQIPPKAIQWNCSVWECQSQVMLQGQNRRKETGTTAPWQGGQDPEIRQRSEWRDNVAIGRESTGSNPTGESGDSG